MLVCPSCQKQIPDDARTCAFCGAAIRIPAPPQSFEAVTGAPPPAKPRADEAPAFSGHVEEPSSPGRRLAIAAVVVLALGGAAAAGYFLLGKGGEAKPPTAPPPATQALPGMPAPPPDAPGATPAVQAPDLDAFVGPWVNEDSLTREKTRMEITEEGGSLSVRMFERSTPGEKEMGTAMGIVDPATGAVALTWTTEEKTEQQHIKLLQDGRLKLWGTVQFSRGSTRVNREYDNYFKRFIPPAPTEEEIRAAADKEKAKTPPAKGKRGKRGR